MTGRLTMTPDIAALGVSMRPETGDDIAFLRRLHVANRWHELTQTGWPDAQKAAFLGQQADFQRIHYAKAYGDAAFLIVEAQAGPIGRLCVWRSADEICIVDIALLPEAHNRGIGSALLRSVMEEARALGLPVRLSVEQFNPAQRLYRRLGFKETGAAAPYLRMEWRGPPET